MTADRFEYSRRRPGYPAAQGLYDPAFEHDACGVGMICNLKGIQSHEIVHKGLEILVNLTHRGACGCDEKTGDGAGILIQTPHKFLQKAAGAEGIRLPDLHEYACGLVFLPRIKEQREWCRARFREIVETEGQQFLGWRDLPVNPDVLGEVSREAEPFIAQIFIGRGAGITDLRQFERKLFVIRKLIEKEVRESDLTERGFFYVPSLSSRTLVYKGLLLADQVEPFFHADLQDEDLVSGLALVHQRYSTNTFPTWDLAQPFRFLCHNGEINTLRGNVNWMNAREHLFTSRLFGEDMRKLFPICTPGASDSAVLDNALELLYHTGRSLPHAIMMLIPEAWQNHATMSDEKKAFYQYHACLMEPWDGPASIPFTDGQCVGAVLDRNGLRPSRYTVTKDGYVIMGSETGVLEVDPANVESKGRLQPGRMFLVDMEQGRIIDDDEIKSEIARAKPYRKWLQENLIEFRDLPSPQELPEPEQAPRLVRQRAFGFSLEDMKVVLGPMIRDGKEALGSMGDDTPLAVLSDKSRLLYDYFKQLFAQVTNPPFDPFRERVVSSVLTTLGAEQDLFQESPKHCHQFNLPEPVITNEQLFQIKRMYVGDIRSVTLPMLFSVKEGGAGLRSAMQQLCKMAAGAVRGGASILVLSDRDTDADRAPIPALLAAAGVHHHLIRAGLRTRCGLVIESGEPREVHHFCCLLAYGAGAINPYLAFETIRTMVDEQADPTLTFDKAIANYIKATGDGILKVMSKMGISTLHSYRGAQILEAVGLNKSVIDEYFTGTSSRIGGVDLDIIAEEVLQRHRHAFMPEHPAEELDLEVGGKYQWRRQGEYHQFNPVTVAKLQQATRTNDPKVYREYADGINVQNRQLGTLRGLMAFKGRRPPVPIEEVEPWTEITKRFKSGAMSYGSISKEAHETLAIAMNRIGGKSNSGEGGEDEDRFTPDANGDSRNSAIKQVASGRFGVTSHYLANAQELQIKMAQGAKPGEGGELPGFKVYPWIAKTRHSTPWVGLISPPPHHDIYSIEDLSQLIHDLKNSNPEARVNVKLVSEVGVGTVAAGVSKGKADVVLISGYDGGTGASKQTSIKHAGLPWELGLAETHQTLVLNDLRDRIVVECDGQMKTGRDVAVACLLGAEEFGFATAPLVVMGCIMMRVCHLNTCPVGIATQNPELRKKFTGSPDHVVNYFRFIAEELRQIMAELGFRTVNEMVGQTDCLDMRQALDHWKAKGLDYSAILRKVEPRPGSTLYCSKAQDHGLEAALDHELIRLARPAIDSGERVEAEIQIRNVNRTVGTLLSYEISKRHGGAGLPEDTVVFNCRGSAGQSFAAFGARGVTFHIKGDANDYFGKGLSGAKLSITPPPESTFAPEANIIIGNVAFYGATYGEAYIQGRAGERFCVRNSGVRTVVEGIGDHGCEYMTGGRVVVLGPTGRNFAAGMSGGIAYVLNESGDFGRHRCNHETVELERMENPEDIRELRELIKAHVRYTGSSVAQRVLDEWETMLPRFVKVMPIDYKKALAILAKEAEEAAANTEHDQTLQHATV